MCESNLKFCGPIFLTSSWKLCTYNFERLLNDENCFISKTKLITMIILRAFYIYNLSRIIRFS